MIQYLPNCWLYHTWVVFKSHLTVTKASIFEEYIIKFVKEEACTSAFNQAYDKSQTNQVSYALCYSSYDWVNNIMS